MLDTEMSASWREAGVALGVVVVAPHALRLSTGVTVEVEVFRPDFGGPQGVIAVAAADAHRFRIVAETRYFVSQLSNSYRRFEGALFKDTLNDWGWYGAGGRPQWYTGKPWTG